MSDKEADKFNNINLSSDSDQGGQSGEEDDTDVIPMEVHFEQPPPKSSQSNRRSLRPRHPIVRKEIKSVIIPLIPPKKKKRTKKKRYSYAVPEQIKFERDMEEMANSRFKGPCYCKSQTTKCIKLTDEDRLGVFAHVKNLPLEWRQGFVTELVRRMPIKGKYARKDPCRKRRSWIIYFHLPKVCGTVLPVCKLMFMNTTGFTSNFINKCLVKNELDFPQGTNEPSEDSDNYSSINTDQPVSKDIHPDETDNKAPPSLVCQYDDQNNPIVVTASAQDHQSSHFNSSETKSTQSQRSGKRKTPDSIQLEVPVRPVPETFALTSPPIKTSTQSSTPIASDGQAHPVTSSESSPLENSIRNGEDENHTSNTLQSKNMNQREENDSSNSIRWGEWTKTKTPRDLGQSYISKSGKFVPARKLKDRCMCRSEKTRCVDFTEEDRLAVFEHVWSLAKHEKKDFISEFVERVPVKRKRTPTSKKEWTFQFHLQKINGDIITVCKKMFMKTTSLTSFLIRGVVAKKDLSYPTMIQPDTLFYSKYSYDDPNLSSFEDSQPIEEAPSLVCQFDDQNNPIIVTAWDSESKELDKDRVASSMPQ